MGNVIVTLKIMPESPDADLGAIQKHAEKEAAAHGCQVGKVEIEPIAFGLKAVKLYLIMDENKGGTDVLEEKISKIAHVESVNVVDVRRALG